MITLDQINAADTYNVGLKYLGTLGKLHQQGFTPTFRTRLALTKNNKEYNALIDTATDKDRILALDPNLTIHDFKTSNDYEVYLLVKQYHYGIEAQKDLYNKLIYLGVLENPIS